MHLKTRFHGQMSDTFHAAVFVTLSGGFQDAYTYICRGQVFANAQTGDIVLLSAALLRGDWAVCLRYAIPLLSFVFGTMAADIRAIWVCCGLLVGRRRIALFGGGVPEKPCEKVTKTYWLTLPGGFSLPLGIAITGIYEYDTRDEILQEASVQQSLLGQIQTRAQRDMIAGTILDSRCRIQTADGCIRLCATLRCEEMIARMQPANLKEAIE